MSPPLRSPQEELIFCSHLFTLSEVIDETTYRCTQRAAHRWVDPSQRI